MTPPARPILARDLGDGPHRPFGAALGGKYAGNLEPLPRIGRTRRLRSEPPCSICGNRSAWRCDCDCETGDDE